MNATQGDAAPAHDPPVSDDEALFAALYESAGSAVLGFALARTGRREDALDVTAETFLVAWRRRADVPQEPEQARAWVFGIARWCLANHARGDRRAHRLGQRLAEHLPVASVPDPARIHQSRDDTRAVREALDRLSDIDRELVTLTAWDGLTPTQAAAALGLHPSTARSRLHRARLRLRAALHPSPIKLEDNDHEH